MTMLKLLALSASCGVLLAGFVACGNDDSNANSTPSTPIPGVAGTTQVSQLTPAQQEQAVKDINAYYAASITPEMMKQFYCGTLAMMAAMGGGADAKSACQTAYDNCMKSASDAGTTGQQGETAITASDLSSCTATVDEVNRCYTDSIAATKAMVASMNCNALTADGGTSSGDGGASTESSQASSCQAIQTKCPGVAPSSDVGGLDTETTETDAGLDRAPPVDQQDA
jgi:hypothetical protein